MNAGDIKGRQKTFAEKVAEGHTATEAYLLAGYRPVKRETAHRAASRLYAKPGIRTYIRELRRSGDELAREETTLTIAKKLAFLARLVLTSSATLREDDPLIQSHRILKDGSTSIRIPCKLKALKMHSELAGHFLPEPTEPPPPVDSLQILFDQIRAGRFSADSTQTSSSQPEHLSKDAHSRTATDDMIGIAEHPHSSYSMRHINAPVPQTTANQALSSTNTQTKPSEQIFQTQQTSTATLSQSEKLGLTSGDESPATSPEIKSQTAASYEDPTATHSFPSGKTLPLRQPHSPPTPERAPNPTAPPPVCKLKTEPLKTLYPSPPPDPTQLRKLMLAQLRQESSLHFPEPACQYPPSPPRVIRP